MSNNTACWYAVYIASKAEEKVKEQLDQLGCECYLPLQSVVRVWNNHQRKIMTPIIRRIVFVCLCKDEVAKVAALGVSFLSKQEECYVSVSDNELRSFREQVERADGILEFIFGELGEDEQNVLINIEGLGTIILRK